MEGDDCILCGSVLGRVAGSYENVNESLCSKKKGRKFLELQLSASLRLCSMALKSE
jgi:hypothetical protein